MSTGPRITATVGKGPTTIYRDGMPSENVWGNPLDGQAYGRIQDERSGTIAQQRRAKYARIKAAKRRRLHGA